MRRLMLLRHAKSDWPSAPIGDHERPLSARGRDAAPKMGAYMARQGLAPDLTLCSTSVRTRQTYEHIAAALQSRADVMFDPRLYHAAPELMIEVIRETRPDTHALLLIGHNPGMQELAELLIVSGDSDLRQRVVEKFPTCALAVIDFPLDDWCELQPRTGRIDRFVTPRTIGVSSD